MANQMALYYPRAHFPDDNWLKLSALYFHKVKRIVPDQFPSSDSTTVLALKHDAGLIEEINPSPGAHRVEGVFEAIMYQFGDELLAIHHLKQTDFAQRLPLDARTSVFAVPLWSGSGKPNPELQNVNISYLRNEKFSPRLLGQLMDMGLATPVMFDRSGVPRDTSDEYGAYGSEWIALSRRFSSVYMTTLAADIAEAAGLDPVTDEIDPFIACHCTPDRIARALFAHPTQEDLLQDTSPVTAGEIEAALATVSLQTVMPDDISQVPVERIVELRKRHHDELVEYRLHVRGLAENLAKENITSLSALQEHLEIIYRDQIERPAEQLKRAMKSVRINVGIGLLSLACLTQIGTALAATGQPAIAIGGTIAAAGVSTAHTWRRDRSITRGASPVSYLLQIKDGLKSPAESVSAFARLPFLR